MAKIEIVASIKTKLLIFTSINATIYLWYILKLSIGGQYMYSLYISIVTPCKAQL